MPRRSPPAAGLLLLTAAAVLGCPVLPPHLGPLGKALLSPVVFQGRLSGLARRGPAVQQATFRVERALKGLAADARFAVVEFSLRKNSSSGAARCRGWPFDEQGLRLGGRFVVFAARMRRQRMVAVAAPEPYARRRAVARVLCHACAKAPSVKGLNDEIRVDTHAKLKLKCRISGNPPPKVIWYKNGLRLKADGRIKLRSKRRYSHLVINRVSLEDAGHYKCIAKNILGNATAFANVITTTATTESPFWHLRKDPCPEKNFCLNGGVCIYFKVVKEYACECADGYGGQRCETKVISTLSIDFQD